MRACPARRRESRSRNAPPRAVIAPATYALPMSNTSALSAIRAGSRASRTASIFAMPAAHSPCTSENLAASRSCSARVKRPSHAGSEARNVYARPCTADAGLAQEEVHEQARRAVERRAARSSPRGRGRSPRPDRGPAAPAAPRGRASASRAPRPAPGARASASADPFAAPASARRAAVSARSYVPVARPGAPRARPRPRSATAPGCAPRPGRASRARRRDARSRRRRRRGRTAPRGRWRAPPRLVRPEVDRGEERRSRPTASRCLISATGIPHAEPAPQPAASRGRARIRSRASAFGNEDPRARNDEVRVLDAVGPGDHGDTARGCDNRWRRCPTACRRA